MALVAPLAKRVVSVIDGEVTSRSSLVEAISRDEGLAEELNHKNPKVEVDTTEEISIASDANAIFDKPQLIVTEETAVGRVSWNAGMA